MDLLKNNWKIILVITIFILFGSYIRYINLWNLGAYFDLVVTQYDWGKVHFEIGPYRFWSEYDKTLDYMPGAMYINWLMYWISTFFGGTEQNFVTVMKSFNWIVDILFCFLVYRFSKLNDSITNLQRIFISTFAYAVPSIWAVTGVWGQMDTLVAMIGIIALTFYFYAKEKPEYFPLGNFWLKLHPFFPLITGIILSFGYWIKPTALLLLPMVILLIVHRLDWKGVLQMIFGFLVISAPFAIVPLQANPWKLLHVVTLPLMGFGVNNASREASNFWLLIGQDGNVGKILLNLGFIKLTIYNFAMIICVTWFGLFLLKYFGYLSQKADNLKEKFSFSISSIKSIVKKYTDKFFLKTISFFDVALLSTAFSYIYFIFYIKMLSRYLIMGILISLILLALWKKGREWWWVFTFILITHICYALNQVYTVSNSIPWVVDFNKNIMPFNYLTFVAAMYLISWIVISMIFWRKMEEEGK